MAKSANKITAADASRRRQSPVRALWAARVAQFSRSTYL